MKGITLQELKDEIDEIYNTTEDKTSAVLVFDNTRTPFSKPVIEISKNESGTTFLFI